MTLLSLRTLSTTMILFSSILLSACGGSGESSGSSVDCDKAIKAANAAYVIAEEAAEEAASKNKAIGYTTSGTTDHTAAITASETADIAYENAYENADNVATDAATCNYTKPAKKKNRF